MTLLENAYINVPLGMVLDVSNIDVKTGNGAQYISENYRRKNRLVYIPDFKIASSSLSHYIAGIQLIFGNKGFVLYQEFIESAASHFENQEEEEQLVPNLSVSMNISNAVNSLKLGEFVDVSNIDNNGDGVQIVHDTNSIIGSGKFGVAAVPIVSDNIKNYIYALKLLYGDSAEQTYAKEIGIVDRAISQQNGTSQSLQVPQIPTSRYS